MITVVKLDLGCGLYTGNGKETFHKLFMGAYEHEILFQCPMQGERLISTLFELKQNMWNHLDAHDWKDRE